ncbi:hypothetical protein [Thalassococcus lentus]|uniref:Excinuclease ABC subunit B n=1 Tax=Thalassococcus lentus TaxID=1210524 RepID=A0ABT4XWI9_9RHOB|nr:hypothetical protein [Thalassococcus lentus]MDA7426317.1 hypothetical protein [Thalassococcus lentus]
MRYFILLSCLATPLTAWEFTPTPICTIRHDAEPKVEVTFDGTIYAIHLTRPEGWEEAEVFSMRFEGPNGLTISTTRHRVEGTRLTVEDTGFGNVLNGLQLNATATASVGATSVAIDLEGAAPVVAEFRQCEVQPLA